jgi:tetratricopeptide (TPR) repeat protein
LLSLAEVRQGLLAIIRDRVSYGRHPLQPYLDYAEALTFSPADTDLRMKIFETVQHAAQRDDDRFYAAMFTSVIDFDNPEIARQGWADLAPARTSAYPKAGGFIQYYDTLMKWRTGEKIDPAADFGPLNAPDLDSFKLRLAFDYYLQQGDRDALQKLVDSRDEKDFLSEPVLGGYLKALHFLGKEAALTRANDTARIELAKTVVQSWARPDSESAEPVFELARILHDPQAYPRAWVQTILAAVRNENDRDLILMEDGQLQQDWASVNDAADDYLSRNPTNYDAYWSKAEALVALGRQREALDPLRLYVKYSHNEDDYPDAVALLKKIETETAAPAASK